MVDEKKKEIEKWLLIFFILLSVLFPVYYAEFRSVYYAEFTYANFFAGLAILWMWYQHQPNKVSRFYVGFLCLMLVLYNIAAFYVNITYIRWFWQEFNYSLGFLFFISLLMFADTECIRKRVIPIFLGAICLSSAGAIVLYLTKNLSISLMVGKFLIKPFNPDFYEVQFSWLYYHKSQYSMVLLMFFGIVWTYRGYYKKKWMFVFTVGLLYIALFMSRTFTAVCLSFLIPAGYGLDQMRKKRKKIYKVIFIIMFPIIVCGGTAVQLLSQIRDIGSLGGRRYIWSTAITEIQNNPWGVGKAFAKEKIQVPELSFPVTNCHNVFLNEMYRFSLLVGILFTVIIIIVLLYSLIRYFSFINTGIVLAWMGSMCMDYSLLGREYTLFFFCVFCILYLPYIKQGKETGSGE